MYRTDKYNVELVFNMENGLYVFDNQSATGKTRLCKEIREHQKYGEPLASYTYDDFLLGIQIESVLIPGKYKVIMLDRYDMYEGVGAELIRECANDSIVLVDCKWNFTVSNEEEICFIKMEPYKIEVEV